MPEKEVIKYNLRLNTFLTVFLGLLLLVVLLLASFFSFAINDILEKKLEVRKESSSK